MAAIIVVWLFPPKQSLSSHVNTESRNGMCSSFFFLPLALAAARAAMTFPRATNQETRVSARVYVRVTRVGR